MEPDFEDLVKGVLQLTLLCSVYTKRMSILDHFCEFVSIIWKCLLPT